MDEESRVKSFEDLEVFKRAYRISLEVHRLSLDFPRSEQFVLADQVRPTRCAFGRVTVWISVTSTSNAGSHGAMSIKRSRVC